MQQLWITVKCQNLQNCIIYTHRKAWNGIFYLEELIKVKQCVRWRCLSWSYIQIRLVGLWRTRLICLQTSISVCNTNTWTKIYGIYVYKVIFKSSQNLWFVRYCFKCSLCKNKSTKLNKLRLAANSIKQPLYFISHYYLFNLY